LKKNLGEWREEATYFSGKASESTKTLALGGLAIIWLFKLDTSGGPILEKLFLPPLALLTFSLTLDLLHYVVGAFIWHNFFIWHEKNTKQKKQHDIRAQPWKRNVVDFFFYTKISVMVIAYVWLFIIVLDKLFS
jgi:hypothetical protein